MPLFSCSIDWSSTQRQGIWILRWWTWMSLSDGSLSQAHRRKFITHLCRIFPVFPHSYQGVATEWGSKRTPRGRLISRQNLHGIHFHLLDPSSSAKWKLKRNMSNKIIQRLWWLKDRGNNWSLSPMKNPRQLIMLRGITWLAQLKR